MDTNKVADELYTLLIGIHSRVYRNSAPSDAVFPFVVFNLESVTEVYPSDDYYLYVDVFDSPSGSVRSMETLADSIQLIGRTVINNSSLAIQIEKISRQFISADDLTSSKMITMQFNCRVYFK